MKIYLLPFILLLCLSCKSNDTVEPPPPVPELIIDLPENMTVNLKKEATIKLINVTTNVADWNILPQDEAVNAWCSVNAEKSETAHKICFDVKSNDQVNERTALFTVSGTGVKDQVITLVQLGSDPVLRCLPTSKQLSNKDQDFQLEVVTNIPYRVVCDTTWIRSVSSRSVTTDTIVFQVTENKWFDVRRDTIRLIEDSDRANKLMFSVPVEQAATVLEEQFPGDKKIEVTGVVLTRGNTYGNESVERTIDGNYQTHYSSSRTVLGDSVILDYTLASETERVDYIRLMQRANGDQNSTFSQGSIWYRTASSDWIFIKNFNEPQGSTVETGLTVTAPAGIRVCIQSCRGGAVALAEFECFESADIGDLTQDATYFADRVFSELKPGVTLADLENITNPYVRSVAKALLQGDYPKEFRSRAYGACEDPGDAGGRLKIGSRSEYDNPMGIFFKQDEKYVVFVSKDDDSPVELYIKDFRAGGGNTSYRLKSGLNAIEPPVSGNGYIRYWRADYATAPVVNVHVVSGHEIGFWDKRAGHTNEDWKRILGLAWKLASDQNITNAMIDVLGDRIQLVNTVEAFRKYCFLDVEELVMWHDSIMNIEYRMMGLFKHHAVPYNRTLAARSWSGLPNWGGSAAWFPNTEQEMLSVASLRKSTWVFGHELGHGNQIRPHMLMTGWGETTNNNYNQYVEYLIGNKHNLRLDHERINRKQGDSESVIGGRFNAYLNEAHVVKEPYLTQEGPDYKKGSMNGTGLRGDHFVKCVPLWQLTLYFMIAGEGNDWYRPDFWADVNWAAIQDNRTGLSNGERYVNFMKRSIEASGYNLAPFFEQMGLLRVIDRSIDDYAVGQVTITQADVDEVKALGAAKPMPSSPVISYISANSVDAFKNRRAVSGTFNQGVTTNGATKSILHSVWRNVVVFETYKGDDLVDIAMVGTGSSDNSSTHVRYPEGSTRIEAVGWNGERVLVFGAR